MIQVKNIDKTYQMGKTQVKALTGVSLSIDKGSINCIVGPSGCGKSTLLNIVGCLDKPDSGEVSIDSQDVVSFNRNQLASLRANKIGFIFQDFNLIPVLNVYENIELPLALKKEKISSEDNREWIMHLIREVGLEAQINQKPDELSGGQRQRVAIARALVGKPSIVLADEPTANLDSQTANTILELINNLNRKEKVTFLFSTHDRAITGYASHVYHMRDGAVENITKNATAGNGRHG